MYLCIVILGCHLAGASTWQGFFPTSGYPTEVREQKFYQPRRYETDNTREYLVNYRAPSEGYNTNKDMNKENNVRKEVDNFREYQADSKRIGNDGNMASESGYWKQGLRENRIGARKKADFRSRGFQDFHHRNAVAQKTKFFDSAKGEANNFGFRKTEVSDGVRGNYKQHKNYLEGETTKNTTENNGPITFKSVLQDEEFNNNEINRKNSKGISDYMNMNDNSLPYPGTKFRLFQELYPYSQQPIIFY